MNTTRPLNAAVKAQVAADYNALMYTRIAQHNGEAHVFTTGLADLEAWWMALGGRITRDPAPANPGVAVWTLRTDTDHGHGAPVRVLALALDTDQLDAGIADAVA